MIRKPWSAILARAKPRVRLSPRFLKALRKVDERTRESAQRALSNFLRDPGYPSLNFELLRGSKGVWSIRVNDNFRILLRESEDEEGTYFVATHLAKHDIYKRR